LFRFPFPEIHHGHLRFEYEYRPSG
jgi:hypothetical protein